jgi:hypothetical protein
VLLLETALLPVEIKVSSFCCYYARLSRAAAPCQGP